MGAHQIDILKLFFFLFHRPGIRDTDHSLSKQVAAL
jgi:hypothetical protein